MRTPDRASRNAALARHGMHVGIAALTFDGLYTIGYWLILGRDERRAGRYPELKYALIIMQLSVETAAVIHLLSRLRHVQEVTPA